MVSFPRLNPNEYRRAICMRSQSGVFRTQSSTERPSRHDGDIKNYFTNTVRVACPPPLLRTVIDCGFDAKLNWPLYFPPPLFVNVPISAPLDVTNTCSVEVEREQVASTRKLRFDTSYSARVIETESVVEAAGRIVRLAEREVLFRFAVIVAVV